MSVELDALEIEVGETLDVEESAVVLLTGLVGQLDELIAAYEARGIDVAKLVEMRDNLDVKKVALAAAVANVPPIPAP